MSELLSTSNFIETDITFNKSLEYSYLFNMVAFDEVHDYGMEHCQPYL